MGLSGARDKAGHAARSVAGATRSGARVGASAARGVSHVIQRLTRASGAGRTGLSSLIELTAAGALGDAFVAVALAGTLFFSASVDQARGRVALALLVTMAPFAVLAPFIGPVLDRVQQGRRYILAGTLVARGLLCWGMAGAVHSHDEVTLLPAAFGVLVLQKAYGVTRSAITPRLLPREITLVSANARAGLAALVASTLGVLVAGGVDLATGGGSSGATWALRAGTVVYLAAAAMSFRVPERVDAPLPRPAPGGDGPTAPLTRAPEAGARATHPQPPPGPTASPGPGARNGRDRWRSLRRVGPVVGEAMRANATLRAYSGFMVFFLAFLLRSVHFPGVSDKLALGAMIAAAGAGGFLGSMIGSGLRASRPFLITFGMLAFAIVVTVAGAVFFGLWAALVVALVAAFAQVLGKLALDSTVQQEIGEEIRSSAFAASETVHQLSWVAGGLAGLAMSLTNSGVAGLSVAAAGLALSLAVLVAQRRRRLLAGRQAVPSPAGAPPA
jgi:MFS family permease